MFEKKKGGGFGGCSPLNQAHTFNLTLDMWDLLFLNVWKEKGRGVSGLFSRWRLSTKKNRPKDFSLIKIWPKDFSRKKFDRKTFREKKIARKTFREKNLTKRLFAKKIWLKVFRGKKSISKSKLVAFYSLVVIVALLWTIKNFSAQNRANKLRFSI